MASVEAVYPGQSAIFEALFFNDDGATPFAGIASTTWVVRDPDNKLITQGSGSQDIQNPARWTASITIPSTAPATTTGRRYSILWSIKNAKTTLQYKDYFAVKPAVDFDIVDLDRLVIEKTNLIDSLAIDVNSSITQLQIKLLTESGQLVFDSGVLSGGSLPPSINAQEYKVYTYQSPSVITDMTVALNGFKPYIIEWVYTADGIVEREYHFMYVVNYRILSLSNSLRRFIDKAKSRHPNPALQFTEVDLIEYLSQGVALINFTKPTLTDWSIVTCPPSLHMGLIQAGAYCALSAQYIAEGQAAFSFNGQTVTLEVDRTQFIDTALGRMMEFIQTQIPIAKRMWLRSGGNTGHAGGVLGVNVGPSLGWLYRGMRYDNFRRSFASGF